MDRGAWQAIVHGVTESDMTNTHTNYPEFFYPVIHTNETTKEKQAFLGISFSPSICNNSKGSVVSAIRNASAFPFQTISTNNSCRGYHHFSFVI